MRLALADLALEHRRELAAGAAPGGPEVDDDGHVVGALHDVALEGGLGDVGDHALEGRTPGALAELSIESGGVTLAGEEAGEGIPVVLLHGLTATRRYVVMGSRALERDGHRVIAYDARGHGESTPAPDPDAYDYDDLVTDLQAVLDDRGLDRAVLAGASMGAHTAVRLALDAPERVAGLVIATPAFDPDAPREKELERWDALSEGLRSGGVDGFVEAYGEPPVREQWRETIEKVLRQRLSAHDHPDAVADALRAVPRSRPFQSWDDLAAIEPRPSSWRAATTPIPAIPTRSARPTPSGSRAPSCARRSPAAPRSPGRAASSRRSSRS